MNTAAFDFQLYSNSPIIEPQIWSNRVEKYKNCFMIFDTGAYMTTISTRLFDTLNYQYAGEKITTVNSIGGSKNAKYAVIPDLKIGDFCFGPITALVVKFPESMTSHAILGMNVIKNFDTSIIFDEESLTKGLIKMQPRFSLDEIKTADTFDYQYSRFGIWNINKNK